MHTHQIKYAVVLAETLHFGRAAESCFIAQSAFSAQIAKLEREVGATLFERRSNRVALTAAGEAFISRAVHILGEIELATAVARRFGQDHASTLRLGLFAHAAGELTPLIVSAFKSAIPGARVVVSELGIADQIEAIATGVVDIAILNPPVHDDRVELLPLFAEPRFVAVSATSSLKDAASLSVDDLADEMFVRYAKGTPKAWASYWTCEAEAQDRHLSEGAANSASECLEMVAYSDAIDIFPASAARLTRHPAVVFVPLRETGYTSVAVAHRRGETSAAIEAFRTLALREAANNLSLLPLAVHVEDAPPGTLLQAS